jgi:glycosyltransferase 2 family protein
MFVAPVVAGVLYLTQHSALLAVAGRAATHAQSTWSMVALILALSAFPMAALTLGAAANQPLPLLRTTQVELAGTFVNRIAPNGIGRAVVSGRFLVTRGLRSDQAAAAVAATVVAGLIVHTGGIVLTTSLDGVRSMHHLPTLMRPVALATAVLVALAVAGWAAIRRSDRDGRFGLWPRSVARQLMGLLRDPVRAGRVLAGVLTATILTVLAFWASMNAVMPTALLPAATIYLIGTAVSNIAPAPGGIGVTEAALTTGLVMSGMPAAPSLAGVLIFRLVSFWLPTLLGGISWLWLWRSKSLGREPALVAWSRPPHHGPGVASEGTPRVVRTATTAGAPVRA